MGKVKGKASNTLVENRKARHDYFVEEKYEAGIELVGTEVKSIRAGKANLKDSYAEVRNGEVFVRNMHISPYEQGNIFNKDPLRDRKLLLHKSEIDKLIGYTTQQGYTLVPLTLYLKHGRVKVALAVAKGKKNYDKRQSLIEKSAKRDIERQMKNASRY
ncbi:SsrA-binding protein SmpB [Clostridium oceanicum]|uniref:SsrA-binding protein n=1 Tax=Clostridium oceanicum TaxID=1543 RepID=A0ABP3UZH7_9CLOT